MVNETPRTAARWLFEDRATGEIVVAQKPNVALWVLFGVAAVSVVMKPSGGWGRGVEVVELAALTVWALDEIFRGVNPWRRMLGALSLTAGSIYILAG